MWSHGTGSEVMQRIAAPMIGGMITAPLLSLLVVPAVYRMLRRREFRGLVRASQTDLEPGAAHP
jgi:Cu(I)/Ag(I) efflux system membrane protein CusA/SilA